jgi:hypothetical protein
MLSNMWSIIKNKRITSSFRTGVEQIRESKWVSFFYLFCLIITKNIDFLIKLIKNIQQQ